MEQLQKVKAILTRRARDYHLKWLASGRQAEYLLLEHAYRDAILVVENQIEDARMRQDYINPPVKV